MILLDVSTAMDLTAVETPRSLMLIPMNWLLEYITQNLIWRAMAIDIKEENLLCLIN